MYNKLTRTRDAIVHDLPGVTRDLKTGVVEWNDRSFSLIDTGGILPDDPELIPSLIREKVYDEINNADLILFMTDIRAGLLPVEREIAVRLRETGKIIIVICNKADDLKNDYLKHEFYTLGFDSLFNISSEHSINLSDLLDEIVESIPEKSENIAVEKSYSRKIAVIGRPNVGKSTLINKIINEPRMIVSDIPGTTRDVVDIKFNYKGQSFTLLDTGGIRRKSKITKPVEIYSVLKARSTIEKADIVLFLLDSTTVISHQDVSIARLIHEKARSVFIVLNKWDLIQKPEEFYKEALFNIRDFMSIIDYAVVITISGLMGKRVSKLVDSVYDILIDSDKAIPTGELNRALRKYYDEKHPPSAGKGKYIKLNYATQTRVRPCKISVFTNRPKDIPDSYKKYLINRLRDDFSLKGIPVHLSFKQK